MKEDIILGLSKWGGTPYIGLSCSTSMVASIITQPVDQHSDTNRTYQAISPFHQLNDIHFRLNIDTLRSQYGCMERYHYTTRHTM
jgi:hypothetical protein